MDAEPEAALGAGRSAAPTGTPPPGRPLATSHTVPHPLPDKAASASHSFFSLIGGVKGRVRDVERAGAN